MRSKSTYILGAMIVLSLLQATLFSSVRSTIEAAFDRYPDRVATFTTQLGSDENPAELAADIEKVAGVVRAGWSRNMGISPAKTKDWQANSSVTAIEVDSDFTQILLEEDPKIHCDSCGQSRVAVSNQINLADSIEVGSELSVLAKSSVFAGSFSKPVRGVGLTSALFVPSGYFQTVDDQDYVVTVAVLFDVVPEREDVRAIASIVDPNQPESVQIEAAVISSSSEGSVLETIDSSSTIFGQATSLASLITSAVLGFFGLTSQRKELASLRSLGANPAFLRRRTASTAGLHIAGAVLLGALVIAIVQPLVVAVAATYYVPVPIITAVLTATSLAFVYVAMSFLGLWVATRKDPAEVLRDT